MRFKSLTQEEQQAIVRKIQSAWRSHKMRKAALGKTENSSKPEPGAPTVPAVEEPEPRRFQRKPVDIKIAVEFELALIAEEMHKAVEEKAKRDGQEYQATFLKIKTQIEQEKEASVLQEKAELVAATKIQANIRGLLARNKLKKIKEQVGVKNEDQANAQSGTWRGLTTAQRGTSSGQSQGL